MHRNTPRRRKKQRSLRLPVLALGALCLLGSFAIGIQTAGDVRPIAAMRAEEYRVPGDMDGSGRVTREDIIRMLEIAAGLEQATAEQLLADPTDDGQISVEDVLTVLKTQDAS